ncbi:pantothenate kinase [Pradoshia eiseniae]|uniref:Type III pantothenate kinase n=1 Tax=Pradoshia eiseniae TaxID=2064768 RepID=A0A2S7MW21_9BACI|nr:type III pantothenate kinase [Pradoshia eiseniae]PQD93969.1 pantothenate kinase [Pradoshia eiseniae]
MLLVLEIGNTNILIGIYEDDRLRYHWRIETNQRKTEDEYGLVFTQLFRNADVDAQQIKGIIMSSVVPPIMPALINMCTKYFGIEPLVVGPGVKTGLHIKYENPREVGSDRIVNAVAAIEEYGAPIIIVDFGTATTYCYVNEHKQYMGGAIAPGIEISTEALFARASKLPRVEISRPDSIIGKTTVSAMQAGILYGVIGQVEGIVSRIKKQSKQQPKVIATGVWASLIADETSAIDEVAPFLTLKGLQIIYKKNRL